MKNKKNKAWAIVLAVIIMAVVVGSGIYLLLNKESRSQGIVYTNTEYGFTLIFPETWKDYTVKDETFEGVRGSIYRVSFGFTAQDELFHVNMYSKSVWNDLQSEEGPISTYLAENDQYVYAYSTAQDAANETMVARMSEVQEILKTFTLEQSTEPLSDSTTGADVSLTKNSGKYENSTYGFSLEFPATWGEIKEQTDGSGTDFDFVYIELESVNDPARFISIQVINNENRDELLGIIDYKMAYITENSTVSYYYSSGVMGMDDEDSDIQKEVKEIVKTFTLEELTEPLSYSTIGVDVSLVKNSAAFDLSAKQLKDAADECGSQHADGYFDELVSEFSGAEVVHYNFTYIGDSQESDTFRVTLIPNKSDICSAGGDSYPTMLNIDWLVFESSCGSGFDDGSGKPVGCQVVKDVVASSLKLNSN